MRRLSRRMMSSDPVRVRRELLIVSSFALTLVVLAVGQGQLHRGERMDAALSALVLAPFLVAIAVVVWRYPKAVGAGAWCLSIGLSAAFVGRMVAGVVASFETGDLPERLPQLSSFLPLAILLPFVLLSRVHAVAVSAGAALGVALPIGAYLALSPHPAVTRSQLFLIDAYVIAPAATVVLSAVLGRVRDLFEETAVAQQVAEDAAELDSLTGLLNRRGFEHASSPNVGECCLAVIDIDHFKAVNDKEGHAAGDVILKTVGAALARGVRSSDVVARWGGEEFIVRFNHCAELRGGLRAAEKLRALVEAETRVTVSVGVAVYPKSHTLGETFGHADAALYSAKLAGRNRVAAWDHTRGVVDPCPSIPPPQTVDIRSPEESLPA